LNLLSANDVRKQSTSVWSQFGDSLWIPNAKKNALLKRHNLHELQHMGVGKCAVLVAMGSSLESQIESLKKYRHLVDVICCDKAFGPLLEHGIKADVVVVADAGIPFKYIEPWINQTEGVKLMATPYANTEWTHAWKGPVYFYVNQDAIESEQVFLPIIGHDTRVIPASSNVSNAMVVLFTNCENKKNENWGGYERYFLIGYDYSWPVNGNYYAWYDPKPKRNYMNHRTLLDLKQDIVFTSENLVFSCKWLISYITTFELPVVNCCGKGILDIPAKSTLETELKKINPNIKAQQQVKNLFIAWKESFQSYKRSEQNFFSCKEAFLWQ
jgi:hypothetical protein